MIAIIGAMEVEIAGVVSKITELQVVKSGKLQVARGKIGGKEVAVCRCGIGKVNAAAAASFMIERFKDITLVINLGVAGGIKSGIRQGDFVVASAAVQHDYDLSPDGSPVGRVAGYESHEFTCEREAADKMSQALTALGYTHYRGVIASGDQFINCKQKCHDLSTQFRAYACDMETAAIAHVCDLFGKKFLGVRAMSDNADGTAIDDFYTFMQKAAERSIAAVCRFLELA